MKRFPSWTVFQLIQLAGFLAVLAWLIIRPVDGAGAVQTPEIRRVSALCWLGFYGLVLAVEWVPHWIGRRR